jgi:hypothetical protein
MLNSVILNVIHHFFAQSSAELNFIKMLSCYNVSDKPKVNNDLIIGIIVTAAVLIVLIFVLAFRVIRERVCSIYACRIMPWFP